MSKILQNIYKYGQNQQFHMALIIDEIHYTYKDIYESAIARAQHIESDACITRIINGDRQIIFIDTDSVYEQLILWLATLCKGYIPIVSHPHMDNKYRQQLISLLGKTDISNDTQFGVLTSGTTGMPKPLWRTESSWADYFDIQNDSLHSNHATRRFVHGSFSVTGNTNLM